MSLLLDLKPLEFISVTQTVTRRLRHVVVSNCQLQKCQQFVNDKLTAMIEKVSLMSSEHEVRHDTKTTIIHNDRVKTYMGVSSLKV